MSFTILAKEIASTSEDVDFTTGAVTTYTGFTATATQQYATPSNLRWNGKVAEWDAVPGATSYRIVLQGTNGTVAVETSNVNSYDFSSYNVDEGWAFRVNVNATDVSAWLASDVSAWSEEYTNVTIVPGENELPTIKKVADDQLVDDAQVEESEEVADDEEVLVEDATSEDDILEATEDVVDESAPEGTLE